MPNDNEGIDLNLGVTMPFESVIVKLLDVWIRARETMKEDTRDKWDVAGYRLYEATIGRVLVALEKADKKEG